MIDLKNAEEFKRWRTEWLIIFPSGNQAKQDSPMDLGRLAETNGFAPTSKLSAFESSFAAQKNEHPHREGDKMVMSKGKTAGNQPASKVIPCNF